MKKDDPFFLLWDNLVQKVFANKDSIDLTPLTESERIYWFARILIDEVYNGGFDQYFFNSSGNFVRETADSLKRLKMVEQDEILGEATHLLFPDDLPPVSIGDRRRYLRQREESSPTEWAVIQSRLTELDNKFLHDGERLEQQLTEFAFREHLVKMPNVAQD